MQKSRLYIYKDGGMGYPGIIMWTKVNLNQNIITVLKILIVQNLTMNCDLMILRM